MDEAGNSHDEQDKEGKRCFDGEDDEVVIPPAVEGELAEEVCGVAAAGKAGEVSEFANVLGERIGGEGEAVVGPKGSKCRRQNDECGMKHCAKCMLSMTSKFNQPQQPQGGEEEEGIELCGEGAAEHEAGEERVWECGSLRVTMPSVEGEDVEGCDGEIGGGEGAMGEEVGREGVQGQGYERAAPAEEVFGPTGGDCAEEEAEEKNREAPEEDDAGCVEAAMPEQVAAGVVVLVAVPAVKTARVGQVWFENDAEAGEPVGERRVADGDDVPGAPCGVTAQDSVAFVEGGGGGSDLGEGEKKEGRKQKAGSNANDE